jgi:hypothetical protein
LSSTIVDENAGIFVTNMGASGKIAAAATLSGVSAGADPAGV